MISSSNNFDRILSEVGLKRAMEGQSPSYSAYNESKFKRYVTSEYRNSTRKENDEIYRMFEFNLLHMDSGLRLTLTTSESYDGESVVYNVVGMFIITSTNKRLEVLDANFRKKIFYTADLEIPFAETNKLIEE